MALTIRKCEPTTAWPGIQSLRQTPKSSGGRIQRMRVQRWNLAKREPIPNSVYPQPCPSTNTSGTILNPCSGYPIPEGSRNCGDDSNPEPRTADTEMQMRLKFSLVLLIIILALPAMAQQPSFLAEDAGSKYWIRT